ncbi:MAG: hypothetical protein M1830_007563 [Pleopsidium flavum]|nr:MAG: hypothetical protein M1830_007563 [Pleopsidium flavum]
MHLASNPTEQLELPAKPLAPPQRNPLKPTPTVTNRGRSTNGEAAYNHQLESHTYLTTPHESASCIRVTNHVTTSLTVLPSSDQNDDALIRLQESLAAAVRGNKTSADGGVTIISISEDPDLAKKKAELAEREKSRVHRRRQQQEERERDRANRVLGKSGLRTGGVGGLTVGGLEDDDGMATTRARPSKPKRKTRRNSEYSDDEDGFRNRGRTREDEYDEDDGFLVASDEEPEVVEASEEEAEAMEDGMSEEEEKAKKKSPKTERVVEKVEGEEEGGVAARGKRRKVVEDEDDE